MNHYHSGAVNLRFLQKRKGFIMNHRNISRIRFGSQLQWVVVVSLVCVVIIASTAGTASGLSLAAMSLKQGVDHSEVIVVGKIERIDQGNQKEIHYTALIRVEKVLKKNTKGRPVKVRDIVVVKILSNYWGPTGHTKGQEGIWLLGSAPGKMTYEAIHPTRFQPLTKEAEICKLLKKSTKKPTPKYATTGNLLINGGFESGMNPARLNPGSTAIKGWKVIRGSIDYLGSGWQCSNGSYSLDLEGRAAFGGIAQTFNTQPGQVYLVSFDMAGNVDGPAKIKKMKVQAGGQSGEFWFDTTGHRRKALGWQRKTWQFTATDTKTTIEFFSIGKIHGHYGPLLDNVTVMIHPTSKPAKGQKLRRRTRLKKDAKKIRPFMEKVPVDLQHRRNAGVLKRIALPEKLKKALILYYSFDKPTRDTSKTTAPITKPPVPKYRFPGHQYLRQQRKSKKIWGTVEDQSGKGNHGRNYGAKYTPAGVINGAYKFDGRAYISLPGKRFFDGYTDVTISVWFNYQLPFGRGGQILASGGPRSGKDPLTTRINSRGYGDFGLSDMVKGKDIRSIGQFDGARPGSWQMITITLKSGPTNSSYKVYLDGKLINSQEYPGHFTISYDRDMPTQIGAIHGTQGWVGLIDELMIFNQALSAGQVKKLYNAQKIGVSPTYKWFEHVRVQAKQNRRNPFITNINLHKGEYFVLEPYPQDKWTGGGTKTGVYCDYMGYADRGNDWMRLKYQIGDGPLIPVVGGRKYRAGSGGLLKLFCADERVDDNKGRIRVLIKLTSKKPPVQQVRFVAMTPQGVMLQFSPPSGSSGWIDTELYKRGEEMLTAFSRPHSGKQVKVWLAVPVDPKREGDYYLRYRIKTKGSTPKWRMIRLGKAARKKPPQMAPLMDPRGR